MPPRPKPRNVEATASKLAQFLGEVIVHHTPWSAKIGAETAQVVKDKWLEGLEAHASQVIGPLVDRVLASSDPAAEVAQLLGEVGAPSAQFGATIQQFFIYGVMFSLASTALAPFTQVVANDLWALNPDRPLSPPDIATMVVRGIQLGEPATTIAPDWAKAEAAKSGLNGDRFQATVDATGMPPDMTSLFEMIRRSIIDESQLELGIREGDTRDEWIPFVSKLRYVQPSPLDMVRAAVQAQMPYDTAKGWATTLGLEPAGYIEDNPDWFDLLYDTAGRPPGPVELGHMAYRGIIGWEGRGPEVLSFQQGVSESDIKDKWTPALQRLAQYMPPPGEIKGWLAHGAITPEQALALWQMDGVPPDIAKAMLFVAQFEEITTDKALAKGDILTLVQENIVSEDQAAAMLARIGYPLAEAETLVNMAHWRYSMETLRSAVSRLANSYTSYEITAAQAEQGFQALGISADQVKQLLGTLTVQRQVQRTKPTATEIAKVFQYGGLDFTEAMAMLENFGYSAENAWIVLYAQNEGSPGPRPPGTPTVPTSAPTALQDVQQAMTAATSAQSLLASDPTGNAYTAVAAAIAQLVAAAEAIGSAGG